MKCKNYMHIVCIAVKVGFIACAVFVFPSAFVRINESCFDLWLSIKYYFNEMFYFSDEVETTVNNLSSVPFKQFFGLPVSWEEFSYLWQKYWQILVTTKNLQAYFLYLSTLLYDFSRFMLLVGLSVIMLFVVLFKLYMSKQNNDYNKDSKCLSIFKSFETQVYIPVKSHNFM